MTANIRTPQRTVSAMQRFAVSQKNRTEAITISPFSLSLLFSAKTGDSQPLDVKTGGTQPKLSAACFVVQSCLADADFVVFSNYCLIGTRQIRPVFLRALPGIKARRRGKTDCGGTSRNASCNFEQKTFPICIKVLNYQKTQNFLFPKTKNVV